ncbi:hypothetical protein QZH41_002513 [Actinostola sp. cb2023]|nr:hypothetical protein QZH41_002513 [Actinostola sp. cb2023]
MAKIGQGFDGFAKIYVALHKPSSTFIVVKKTNVDFQTSHQLQDLEILLEKLQNPSPRLGDVLLDIMSDTSTISTGTDSTTATTTTTLEAKEPTTSRTPKKFSSTFYQSLLVMVQVSPGHGISPSWSWDKYLLVMG